MKPSAKASGELIKLLQIAFDEFHSQFHLERDPISHVHRFSRPEDQEVVGLVSAILAYGNVATILGSVGRALAVLWENPRRAVARGFATNPLPTFRHRFTTGEDLWVIFERLKAVYASHATLEDFFLVGAEGRGMEEMLSSFVDRFFALPISDAVGEVEKRRVRSLKYLFPHPERGSACKRLNLYLRWMARPADGVDLGLWKKLGPDRLLLPVDTHLLKVLQDLKWTKSNVANWKVAVAATEALRVISPDDPVKFDFSLCHLSMSKHAIKDYWKNKRGLL